MSSIWRIPPQRIANCRAPPRTQLLYLRLSTNRNALPGTPPRTEMLYLGHPNEQKCFTWDFPRTEMLYLGRPHQQKCFTWDSPTNRNALPGIPWPEALQVAILRGGILQMEHPPVRLENCKRIHRLALLACLTPRVVPMGGPSGKRKCTGCNGDRGLAQLSDQAVANWTTLEGKASLNASDFRRSV